MQPEIPGYRIERALGNGDARTYLARHLALERQVVLKLLPANAIESARLLASVRHPNLVSVHAAQSGDRLSYVDLEYLGGDPLTSRFGKPLAPAEVLRLCRDLTGALSALHAAGIAHGEVRAGNVFRVGNRFILADSATAGPLDPAARAADLRAAAQVLAEALTGRDWTALNGKPSWKGVPRGVRRVLERALLADPERGWPDASAFRRAFERAARRRLPRARTWLPLAAAVAGLAVWWVWPRAPLSPGGSPGELAVLPFRVVGGGPTEAISQELAQLLQLELDGTPGFRVASQRRVLRWWQSGGREAAGGDKVQAARELKVRWIGVGQAERRGDSLRLALVLHDSLGTKLSMPEIVGRETDVATLGERLSVEILRAVAPGIRRDPAAAAVLQGVGLDALKLFLQGEAAFQRDAFAEAERHYRAALARDPTLGLAEWRLANVLRWRREPSDLDLATLYRRQPARFRPLDRLLIEALLEPDLRRRFELLEAATTRYPDDAYAQLLYGDELFHRGPHVGRGMEESIRPMERAIARDSLLGLAYDHVVFAQIRLGRRDEARRMLALRRRIARDRSGEDLDVVPLLGLALDERFTPWRAAIKRWYLSRRADPARLRGIEKVVRFATPWFDIPHSQLALSELLLEQRPTDPGRQADAHEAMGLALHALGRPSEAVARFDSAAALLNDPEARLQQAQWRVLPAALGLTPRDPAIAADGLTRLESLAADTVVAGRAAWSLALSRYAAGDTLAGRAWTDRVRGADVLPLRRLLHAVALAARGDHSAALAASDSVDAAFTGTQPPGAFAAAAFHLLRGEWAAASGDTLLADREWLWYEGSDLEGWSRGLAQAGDVNAALGVAARLKRGRLLLAHARERADSARACGMLARVAELWGDAEPAMEALADEAGSLAERCR